VIRKLLRTCGKQFATLFGHPIADDYRGAVFVIINTFVAASMRRAPRTSSRR
jgi:hypothetical protein